MTIREIRSELKKLYKERNSWDGTKGPLTETVIRQRELILLKQQILYRIEEAKQCGDKIEEIFNLKIYQAINNYLKELQNEIS